MAAWIEQQYEIPVDVVPRVAIAPSSQPCMPTDHPAISIQRCDASKVQEDMAEILKLHGFEFRVGFRNDPDESIHYSGMRQYWVRRSEPQSRYE